MGWRELILPFVLAVLKSAVTAIEKALASSQISTKGSEAQLASAKWHLREASRLLRATKIARADPTPKPTPAAKS